MSVVISVENVSKQYRLGQVGTGTLSHDVNRWWHKVRGKEDPYLKVGEANDRSKKGESDYSWALRDVSFEVKQGEVLGIIGRNGAGKSTLLKILSRVTRPTTGEIKVKGRIASLLEVGTGFHPELTGRENIYLNGAILGMRKAEIATKFDEIVAFSGCERYIDTPVKRYSSGMYVRLAFAVAAHLEPEILIVDEVLAVGDAEFQKKCMGKMKDVAGEGRTVLFVSHNMTAVRQLCGRILLMSSGRLQTAGSASTVIKEYLCHAGALSTSWIRGNRQLPAIGGFKEITLELKGDQPDHVLVITVVLNLRLSRKAMLAFEISDSSEAIIMQVLPNPESFIRGCGSSQKVKIAVALPPLVPGSYGLSAWMGTHNTDTLEEVKRCVQFEISQSPTVGRTFPHTVDHGWIAPKILSINIEDYDIEDKELPRI